jgi:hypothetical protein
MLGYINRMLMAKDIDDKFEHYLEHMLLVMLLSTSSSPLSLYISSVASMFQVFHMF